MAPSLASFQATNQRISQFHSLSQRVAYLHRNKSATEYDKRAMDRKISDSHILMNRATHLVYEVVTSNYAHNSLYGRETDRDWNEISGRYEELGRISDRLSAVLQECLVILGDN